MIYCLVGGKQESSLPCLVTHRGASYSFLFVCSFVHLQSQPQHSHSEKRRPDKQQRQPPPPLHDVHHHSITSSVHKTQQAHATTSSLAILIRSIKLRPILSTLYKHDLLPFLTSLHFTTQRPFLLYCCAVLCFALQLTKTLLTPSVRPSIRPSVSCIASHGCARYLPSAGLLYKNTTSTSSSSTSTTATATPATQSTSIHPSSDHRFARAKRMREKDAMKVLA